VRINATVPLARLTIDDERVRVRLRGRLGRSARAQFATSLADIVVAYPLRGHIFAAGVGFDLRHEQFLLFYTWRRRYEVLQALRRRSVPIDETPRRAMTQFFRLRV
jgi:hypothetical protein